MRNMGPAAAMLSLAVLPAACEELACRGAVYDAFRRRSYIWANVMAAASFAILHGSPAQIAYALPFGLFMGALRELSGSVLPCMAAHMAFNGTSVAAALVVADPSQSAAPWPLLIAAGAMSLLTCYAMIFPSMKNKKFLPDPDPEIRPLGAASAALFMLSAAVSALLRA